MDKRTVKLAIENAHLIDVVLSKFYFDQNPLIEQEDAHSIAKLALLKACQRFDPSQGCAVVFFMKRIRGSILDAMRSADPLPRKVRGKVRELANKEEDLTVSLGRGPNEEELATYTGNSIGYIRKIKKINGATNPTTIDDEEQIFHNICFDPTEPLPSETATYHDMCGMVRVALNLLSDKQREAIEFRYYHDMTLEEIAERCGISYQAAAHRCNFGVRELRRHLLGVI